MLYRLLRPDESLSVRLLQGLSAKQPSFNISVVEHVSTGSSAGFQSQYISTSGSLNSVLQFRKNIEKEIVQISEDCLPVTKIDLRTSSSRSEHFVPGMFPNELINKFNNFARVYEEVLLVGHVPASHIQLLNESDFVVVQLPV